MKITITVFKKTGKYYASETVERDENIRIFDAGFKEFIANNLPAIVSNGYTVVMDTEDAPAGEFHISHFENNELLKYRTK